MTTLVSSSDVTAHQEKTRREGRSRIRPAIVLLSVATGLLGTALTGPAASATTTLTTASALYASPAGTGKTCTAAAPCTAATAVSIAPAGATVNLGAGDYGSVTFTGGHGNPANRVTVKGAAGGASTFFNLKTQSPNVYWTGVTATNVFYMYADAVNTYINAVDLNGAGMFIHSNNTTVVNSTFHDGKSIDGINIGGANGVVIAGNDVHDYNQSGTSGLHADCIQLFDSSNITITGNRLHNCYNSGIIFSGGADKGINNVDVESNFIEGCMVKSQLCNNGNDLDLRYTKTSNITVRYNTFAYGTVQLSSPRTVFDHNIVHYLSDCTSSMTNSIIEDWNHGLCKFPNALGQNGNRQSTVNYVNPATDDLHLLVPAQAQIFPSANPQVSPKAVDFDGNAIQVNVAGAHTPMVSTSLTTDTSAPSVTVLSPTAGTAVKGTVQAVASATDNVGVVAVNFYINGSLAGPAKLVNGQWVLSINSAGTPKGTYQVTAQAFDAAGNHSASNLVPVRVS